MDIHNLCKLLFSYYKNPTQIEFILIQYLQWSRKNYYLFHNQFDSFEKAPRSFTTPHT